MIIHIFPKEKFTKINIEILNTSSYNHECIFFIINNNKIVDEGLEKLASNGNVFFIGSLFDQKVHKYLVNSSMVIFHSLFIKKSDFLLLFLLSSHAKNWNWVIWGGDLHESKGNISGFKYKLKQILKKSFVNKLGFVTTLADKDFDIFKDKFTRFNGKHLKAVYGIPGLDIIEKCNSKKKSRDIKILVGNSANPSNQHIETFNILSKYSKYEHQIIVPLSYGSNDRRYIEEVIYYGKNFYKGDALFLQQYMNPDEYYSNLNNVDVAIFNTERQQALGNIYVLLFFGAKVYLNKKSGLIEKFTQEGAKVFSIEELKSDSYEEFLSLSESDKIKNRNVAAKLLDRNQILFCWDQIMESMKEQG